MLRQRATQRRYDRQLLEERRETMSTLHKLDPKAAAQPRRRVLVVDDDLDSVHSIALLLKMMGHEFEFEINAFAALDVARRLRPDVLLLDINLPDFAGYDIPRQLKWEPGDRKSTRLNS